MKASVKAAVMKRPGVIALEQFPLPEPERGAVVLEMSMSGICGTDKHTFRGETLQYAGTPHERQIEYPLICGHENVGRVAATGGEVLDSEGRRCAPGDRVVPAANVSCGRCWYCQNGLPYYMCEQLEDYGNSLNCARPPHLFGGWSEYMYLLPGTQLFRVPDALPDHVAVLTEPMAVTHGFDRARRLNDTFARDGRHLRRRPARHVSRDQGAPHGGRKADRHRPVPTRLQRAGGVRCRRYSTRASSSPTSCSPASASKPAAAGPTSSSTAAAFPRRSSPACAWYAWAARSSRPALSSTWVPSQVNPNADICSRNVAVLGIGGETAESYAPAMELLARNLDRLPFERSSRIASR